MESARQGFVYVVWMEMGVLYDQVFSVGRRTPSPPFSRVCGGRRDGGLGVIGARLRGIACGRVSSRVPRCTYARHFSRWGGRVPTLEWPGGIVRGGMGREGAIVCSALIPGNALSKADGKSGRPSKRESDTIQGV